MSVFVKLFSGGDKLRKKPCQAEEIEKLPEREELLLKKRDFLMEKIDQELLIVKKNNRQNRRVALQALRRKKWYEKHVKYIDCAVKAVKSAHEHIDIVNKVNDLIKGITEELEGTQEVSDTLYTSDELFEELERLEKNLNPFEEYRMEDSIPCAKAPSPASPSHPAKTEEEEVEEDLEYLRSWGNEPSKTHHQPQHTGI